MGTLLITLDVVPATIATFFEDPLLAPILEPRTDLVEFGTIESVAATRPSIILGVAHPNHMEVVEDYAGIAPTVLPDFTSTWQDQTRLIAQVVGREDRADAVIGAVEARIEALAAELEAEGLAGERATIIQDFGGSYFAYGPTTISGAMLEGLGFTRSEAQSGSENFGFIPLAQELVPDETAVPFVFGVQTTSPDGAGRTASLRDDPLVDAEGRTVVDVGEAWFNNTALGAWIVLDDVEAAIFGRGEITGLDGAAAAFDSLLAAAEG